MSEEDPKTTPRARVIRPGAELDAAFAVRRAVFIDEQNVREDEEFDTFDADATHMVVEVDGRIVGTARLRFVWGREGHEDQDGHESDAKEDGRVNGKRLGKLGKLERVAVLPSHRNSGAGRALIALAHAEARRAHVEEVYLAAQLEAIPFYERVGYEPYGDEFEQERIRHRWMRHRLV